MTVAELEQNVLLDVCSGIQIWLPRALASDFNNLGSCKTGNRELH